MKRYYWLNLALRLLLLGQLLAIANGALAQGQTTYSIETDPATFVLNGYAAHVRVAPAALDHWVFGFGVYALDIPDVMVDMNSANKGQGWQPRLDQGLGLFAEYFFDPSRQGWFVGGQLALQDFRLANTNTPGTGANYTNALLMAHTGYRWYPRGKQSWYMQPWLGVGYTRTISGQTTVGTQTYDVAPIVPFATLHVGYEF